MSSCRHSAAADLDIKEIGLYLFNLNPVAAYRFLETLEETCELLAEHPELGRTRESLGAGLRSFPIGNYLIFYLIAPDGIRVVRIVYGGRDLPGIFRR
jgi:toxin ParE1/3/4